MTTAIGRPFVKERQDLLQVQVAPVSLHDYNLEFTPSLDSESLAAPLFSPLRFTGRSSRSVHRSIIACASCGIKVDVIPLAVIRQMPVRDVPDNLLSPACSAPILWTDPCHQICVP